MRTAAILAVSLCLGACFFRDEGPDSHDPIDHVSPPSVQDAPRNPPSSSGAAGRAAPRADFCQDWARAACSGAVISACQASDEEECRGTQAEHCRKMVPSEVPESARGQCISAVTAAYADADLRGDELKLVLRLGGQCERVLRGSKAAGDGCAEAAECDRQRGYTCVRKADATEGSCQIPQTVSPGRECRAAEKVCSTGFYCDGHNCVETVALGAPCTIHEQCGAAGFCSEAGQCSELIGVNDACKRDLECEHGICSEFDGQQVCTDRVVLSRADPLCADLR